ncbi:hypothetical protein [Idiomarina xiamenensis]|uniref:Uncharacterized protein n=1 Tax=Idiomarina xiamenensis 10-D-4 TaxID=740709 RepID=K2K9N3_9GAMM|nr:hypothetical protein [Idiomarina xiamenensis]EKE84513.1 hypothetical protein A10D4_05577 [Idiomarina xiamenensis 10-D-4]
MLLRTAIATLLLGSLALIAMLMPAPPQFAANLTQQCEQVLAKSELGGIEQRCAADQQQVSWSQWATGESRSTQFHFIDLFELVFGSSSQQQKSDLKQSDMNQSSL